MTPPSRHRHRSRDDIEEDRSYSSSKTHGNHHYHHHRDEKRRERERSRSPSSSNRGSREKREETREERRNRKIGEKEKEERYSSDKHSDRRRSRRDDRSSKRHKVDDVSRVFDEDPSGGQPHKEMFADGHPSRFQKSVSMLSNPVSLALQSHAASSQSANPRHSHEEPATISSAQKRDKWMLIDTNDEADTDSTSNYFSALGSYERVKESKPDKSNPDQLQVSSREINTQFAKGKHLDEYEKMAASTHRPGGAGYQWRMMKLRRVYEAAEDEDRNVDEVALERYGSMDAFNEARTERQYLDDQQSKRGEGSSHRDTRRTVNESPDSTTSSRPISRQSFRKPGESSLPSTPQAEAGAESLAGQIAPSRQINSTHSSKPSTPIPSVFTPTLSRAGSKLRHLTNEQDDDSDGGSSSTLHKAVIESQFKLKESNPPLSAMALNKLSAKVMRAEMMNSDDAVELREQLEREMARAQNGGGDQGFGEAGSDVYHRIGGEEDLSNDGNHIQVLPTLDGRGRLYDVGMGRGDNDGGDAIHRPGNRKRKNKFETRDTKTGELLRYNADDDEQSLQDLVRQERFEAGSADQKNADAEMASKILSDQAFKDNIDYMDDNVERLARKKMKSDAMKRQFAIQDFAKTKKALDSCSYCWQDEGSKPPRVSVVCSGTRTYLSLPNVEALTTGHCLIVPMQHHLSSLEAEDDTWEEVKNFMKCLMQMAASQKQGVVFYETVKSIKQQRHTVIEAITLDFDLFQELPAYFKQSISTIGNEWSQHKKLIEFSTSRPFRRCMVPQLPYFMVQWDYKGEKGYGHVIEDGDGYDDGGGGGGGDGYDGFQMAESSKGGGDFPSWFAAEIIGNLLDYEPSRWRKPRRLYESERQSKLESFRKMWKPFDWTTMLDQA